MADQPLSPVGGKAPLPVSSPTDSAQPSSPAPQTGEQTPLGSGPSAVVTLSDTAIEAAGDDDNAIVGGQQALEDAASLIKDLAKAVRKLHKAVFRLMHHLEKLQHHAQKIADKFFDNISRDIGAGRFEDYTHGQAISTLIDQFGTAGQGEEEGDEGVRSLDDLSRAIGAGDLLDETQTSALAITYSQSITLSVKSLEFTYQDGDQNISLSYQSISFSVTTTIGAVFAQSDPQVVDTEGNTVDTATQNNGVFFDAKLESVADIVARLRLRGGDEEDGTDGPGDELQGLRALIAALARSLEGGEGGEGGEGALGADATVFGGLNTLALIREVSFTQTVTGIGITRILLDAATQVRQGAEGGGDTADTASTVGETPVDLQI